MIYVLANAFLCILIIVAMIFSTIKDYKKYTEDKKVWEKEVCKWSRILIISDIVMLLFIAWAMIQIIKRSALQY